MKRDSATDPEGHPGMTRRGFFEWSLRGGMCLALGYPIAIEPRLFVLEDQELPIADLPPGLDGLRIGLISDFHVCELLEEEDFEDVVSLLQKGEPDLVVLAGDYVDEDAAYVLPLTAALSKLKAPLGMYGVLGNHDYWSSPRLIRNAFQKARIRMLVNESVRLSWHGDDLFLLGVDDVLEGAPSMEKALRGVPRDGMKILAVHEPDYADRIQRLPIWLPVQLSGHSHGGQVILPFVGFPHLPPMGKKYPMGLQRVPNTDRWVYTTRGVGHVVRLRFNCNPEVTLLTLRAVV